MLLLLFNKHTEVLKGEKIHIIMQILMLLLLFNKHTEVLKGKIHITIQILMLLLLFNKHTEVLKGKKNTHYNTDSNVITSLQ